MSDFEERDLRLAEGAEALAAQRGEGSVVNNRQFLLAAAGALMTLGLTAIILGWVGASRSTLVEEQVPYLISGGLLGLALSVIGALSFFSHWFVTGIREARAHEAARQRDHAELIGALTTLTDALTLEEGNRNGAARSARSARSVRRTASR
jgi:hypothetical protein